MSDRYIGEVLKDGPTWFYTLSDAGPDDLGVEFLRPIVGPSGVYTTPANIIRAVPGPISNTMGMSGVNVARAGGAGTMSVAEIETGTTIGGGDFTMECWMDIVSQTAASRQNLWGKEQSAELSMGFALDTSDRVTARFNDSTQSDVLLDSTPGGWKHYAFSLSGTTVKRYLNGASAGTDITLTVKNFVSEGTQIDIKGHPAASGINFNIASLVIYTSELPADRVKAHYDAGLSANFRNSIGFHAGYHYL